MAFTTYTQELGFLAETLVMVELSRRGIYSVRLPPLFDFDLYCSNNARIEVKSCGHPYSYYGPTKSWRFSNHKSKKKRINGVIKSTKVKRDRKCDYFVLVGFDGDNSPNYFILPKDIVKDRQAIAISTIPGYKHWNYHNKWDLITTFGI